MLKQISLYEYLGSNMSHKSVTVHKAVSSSIPGKKGFFIKRFLFGSRKDGGADPQSLVFVPNIPG